MKFRNPETGEVFDVSHHVAFTGFCYRIRCCDCPIRMAVPYCNKFINEHPHEAAALMGYEVIKENSDNLSQTLINRDKTLIKTVPGHEPLTAEQQKDMAEFIDYKLAEKEEANMDKPLKDWTLGEIKEECKKHTNSCDDCPIKDICGSFESSPEDWDLEDQKNKWTDQEVEDAKTIKRMFGASNFTHIHKNEDGWPEMMDGPGEDGTIGWCSIGMEKGMFPSLRLGETVTLDDIIGGAE